MQQHAAAQNQMFQNKTTDPSSSNKFVDVEVPLQRLFLVLTEFVVMVLNDEVSSQRRGINPPAEMLRRDACPKS
jgi:hypothetical protein